MRNHVPDGQVKKADVVIVGAGVIGLSIARCLAQKGLHRIIVVERTSPSDEASCAAGGIVAPRSLDPAISSGARAALRFPLDTQVENRKLVKALTRSVERYGAQILNGVTVQSLLIGSSGIEGVHTSSGRIDASLVVVANGAWVSLLTADAPLMPPILIEPVRGQMLCFEADPPIVRHVIYSPRGYLMPRHDV